LISPDRRGGNGDRSARASGRHGVQAVKSRLASQRTPLEKVAERMTHLASGAPFLLLHVLWFAGWILLNLGMFGYQPFDPFPFGLLTMVVSLEAIFLSIFVLMTQSRESRTAELREEMTLEVDLRVEEEVTKTLQLVTGLYSRLGLKLQEDDELREMLLPLDKDEIERELEGQIEESAQRGRKRRG
jgi:uncharacterized membrane protein